MENAYLVLGMRSPTPDRVMMFAVSQYYRNSGGIDSVELTGWLRVCKNLVVNSQIDNLERFVRSIQSIANLSQS